MVGEATGIAPYRSAGPGPTRCVSVLKGIMLTITGKVIIPVCSIIQFMPHIIAKRIDQFCCFNLPFLEPGSETPVTALCKPLLFSTLPATTPHGSRVFPLHSPHQIFFLLSLILFAYIYLTFSLKVSFSFFERLRPTFFRRICGI